MKLKGKRIRNGLTQQDVADICGVSVSTVCAWERGLSVPSSSHLIKYMRALKLEPVEIDRIIEQLAATGRLEQ